MKQNIKNYKVTISEEDKSISISNGEESIAISPKDRELSEDIYIANIDTPVQKEIVQTLIDTGWFVLQEKKFIKTPIEEGEVALVKGFRFRRSFLDFEHSNQDIVRAIFDELLTDTDPNALILDVIEYFLLLIPKMTVPLRIQVSKNRVLEIDKKLVEENYVQAYIDFTYNFIQFLSFSVKDYGYSYREDRIILAKLSNIG